MRKSIILLVSLILGLCTSPALTEEKPKTFELEEIVVTATRIEEEVKDVSASVQVISKEEIRNSTAKNVGDLIAEAGIGHVHKYPGALTARISLRGLTTDLLSDLKNRVLILINGHYAGTVNLAKIPVEDIERIEIVKGPSSVLYGQSAMGGVINIITKKGKKEGISGFGRVEVGSWDYLNPQVELSVKEDPFDFYLTAGCSKRGDYKAKDYGKIQNTASKDNNLSFQLGYKISDNQHISIGFQQWKGWEIGSPDARYSPDPDDYCDKERNGFDVGYKGIIEAKYYLINDRDETFEGPTAGEWDDTPNSISLKKAITQGASLQKTFSIGEHRVIAGGEWNRKEFKSSKTASAPYDPNCKYDTYGAFAEGRLSLLNKKLLPSIGVRYDYFKNRILQTPRIPSVKPREEKIDNVSLRGGVVYKLSDNLSLKGNFGNAFRAPAPDELATDYVSSGGTHYLGNPDLKPEKSISYDGGIEYRKDFLKCALSFFHTDFKNKIVGYYNNSLSAETFKNIDGATLEGIEVNSSYDIGLASGLGISIEPFANVTYHHKYKSKDKDEAKKYGGNLPYIPKWTGAFGIKGGMERWDVRLIANYTGKEKVDDWNPKSPTYGKALDKDDFTVVNVKGSYRPIEGIKITASIENLFDKAYEYVLGYPMPGRSITIGSEIGF